VKVRDYKRRGYERRENERNGFLAYPAPLPSFTPEPKTDDERNSIKEVYHLTESSLDRKLER